MMVVQDACIYIMIAWPYFGILMGLFYVKGVMMFLCRRGHKKNI